MGDQQTELSWKIGGEAGFGIMSVGEMLARICMRAGLHIFSYPEYPSLIRGGHNTVQLTVSTTPVSAHREYVDLLIALNRATLDLHLSEMTAQSVIVYDSSDLTFKDFDPSGVEQHGVELIAMPMEDLARANGGQKLMRNTVALGATCALLDIPEDHLAEVVQDTFGRKGQDIVNLNVAVLMAGYEAITPEDSAGFPQTIKIKKQKSEQAMFTGNDALAMGAIQAGCQFYSAYPMTPASSVLHFLAEHGPSYGMIVRHAEDEIAAIHHAIGAAYAGVRAMTGSAGGGFALMTEAVGMAAMTEVGMVIVEAQRGGPSTGLPTWTEQGDLRQVLHASQGDFPRIVLAPSNHIECFMLMQEAFNLADIYQTPVVIMTDKYLAEGFRNVAIDDLQPLPINRGKIVTKAPKNDGAFPRYQADVEDGVSPRTLPGTTNGLFLANSDEHDAFGYSNEDIDNRLGQMDRRERKMKTLEQNLIPPRVVGPESAPITVVTWGSTAGSVETAAQFLRAEHGIDIKVIIITMVAPFPKEDFMAMMKDAKKTVIVEANQSGQMAGWIRQQTGVTFEYAINRYDGRPFDPVELSDQLFEISKSE